VFKVASLLKLERIVTTIDAPYRSSFKFIVNIFEQGDFDAAFFYMNVVDLSV
jgi:hypothetical protein